MDKNYCALLTEMTIVGYIEPKSNEAQQQKRFFFTLCAKHVVVVIFSFILATF